MIYIGRKELIDLPKLGLEKISAKVDTGAFGSAIHCVYSETKVLNGEDILEVIFLDPSHPQYTGKKFYFKKFGEKIVKSTNGQAQNRYTIESEISLFGKNYILDFSLADRSSMKNPILIGRKFLAHRFIVDVSKKNLSFKQQQK